MFIKIYNLIAWSTKAPSDAARQWQKGITDILITYHLYSFVVGKQHVPSTFELQAGEVYGNQCTKQLQMYIVSQYVPKWLVATAALCGILWCGYCADPTAMILLTKWGRECEAFVVNKVE